jgi:hypothetical protein
MRYYVDAQPWYRDTLRWRALDLGDLFLRVGCVHRVRILLKFKSRNGLKLSAPPKDSGALTFQPA